MHTRIWPSFVSISPHIKRQSYSTDVVAAADVVVIAAVVVVVIVVVAAADVNAVAADDVAAVVAAAWNSSKAHAHRTRLGYGIFFQTTGACK